MGKRGNGAFLLFTAPHVSLDPGPSSHHAEFILVLTKSRSKVNENLLASSIDFMSYSAPPPVTCS